MRIILRCTHQCNFNCIYCFQRERDKGSVARRRMRLDQLETIFSKVKYYLTHEARAKEAVVFEWTGGEPLLLGVNFFRKVFELERRIFQNVRQGVSNTIQTNGSLVSADYIELFNTYHVGVGVSLDVMGKARLSSSGMSRKAVLKKVLWLKRECHGFSGCIVVPTRKNVRFLARIYRQLRDAGVPFHFNYLKQLQEYDEGVALSADELVAGVLPVVQEYVQDTVSVKIDQAYSIPNIDDDLRLALSYPLLAMRTCVYGGCFKDFLCIEPDGSAYPCPSFTCSESRLGNVYRDSIKALMRHPFRRNLQKRRSQLQRLCEGCPHLPSCSGGCMAEAHYGGTMLGRSHFACAYRREICKKINELMRSDD